MSKKQTPPPSPPPTQGELFQAQTTWFHVFKSMVDSGDVAAMGPYAVTVYLVVKSYTNYHTGEAFPSIDLITEKSGLSKSQVIRELKTLTEKGYIGCEKKGRRNIYTLKERVHIADESGRPAAVATWDYLPSAVSHAVADLKNVLLTGDLAGAKIVNIEKLNIIIGDHNTQVVLENPAAVMASLADIKDEKIRASLASLVARTTPR